MLRRFQESDFKDERFNYAAGYKMIYPSQFWESNACFRNKLKVYPEGCLAYVNELEELLGYAVGHPWHTTFPAVPLNLMEIVLPLYPDCFYIHDVAVIPSERKKGVGRILGKALINVARSCRLPKVRLVAVMNSFVFWQKLGFTIVEVLEYVPSELAYVMELKIEYS